MYFKFAAKEFAVGALLVSSVFAREYPESLAALGVYEKDMKKEYESLISNFSDKRANYEKTVDEALEGCKTDINKYVESKKEASKTIVKAFNKGLDSMANLEKEIKGALEKGINGYKELVEEKNRHKLKASEIETLRAGIETEVKNHTKEVTKAYTDAKTKYGEEFCDKVCPLFMNNYVRAKSVQAQSTPSSAPSPQLDNSGTSRVTTGDVVSDDNKPAEASKKIAEASTTIARAYEVFQNETKAAVEEFSTKVAAFRETFGKTNNLYEGHSTKVLEVSDKYSVDCATEYSKVIEEVLKKHKACGSGLADLQSENINATNELLTVSSSHKGLLNSWDNSIKFANMKAENFCATNAVYHMVNDRENFIKMIGDVKTLVDSLIPKFESAYTFKVPALGFGTSSSSATSTSDNTTDENKNEKKDESWSKTTIAIIVIVAIAVVAVVGGLVYTFTTSK